MWEFWRSRMSKGKTRHRRRPESDGEELTCVVDGGGLGVFVCVAPAAPLSLGRGCWGSVSTPHTQRREKGRRVLPRPQKRDAPIA